MLFDHMVEAAWATGDPGLLFIDEINKYNPAPGLRATETTNPCGEQTLLPYESCTLGSHQSRRFSRPQPNGLGKTDGGGISKPADLPLDSPPSAVREVFNLARLLNLKGVTVYRYGSRAGPTFSLIGDQAQSDCRECAV